MIKTTNLLNTIADSIEISEKTIELATKRYTNLGEWLDRDESSIKQYEPRIYSQGSIKLGTAIKPINTDDNYDIDAVCVLKNITKDEYSQKNVKELIGVEIKSYVKASGFKKDASDGKRCWTIEYADTEQFHLDILPAIPDKDGMVEVFESNSVSYEDRIFVEDALSITDNTHEYYEELNVQWPKSNPKGYYEWFQIQKKIKMFTKSTDGMMMASESVEEIPEEDVITPLQQAIMILKRHRDIMFNNSDINQYKPISIIITTLSAKEYQGEDNLFDALETILNNIEIDKKDGIFYIPNPVNPLENFADKWEHESLLSEYFFKWLKQIRDDFEVLKNDDVKINKAIFSNMFGESIVNESYEKNGLDDGVLVSLGKKLLSLVHVKKPTWERDVKGTLTIEAVRNLDGFQTKTIKSGERLEKKVNLRFEAKLSKNIKIMKPKFMWQVANSGEEASDANQLRGDFYEGILEKGGKIREEGTRFKGRHFIRCFAIVNKKIVAESEPFIVNIEEYR
jgi:hypothetical protein